MTPREVFEERIIQLGRKARAELDVNQDMPAADRSYLEAVITWCDTPWWVRAKEPA